MILVQILKGIRNVSSFSKENDQIWEIHSSIMRNSPVMTENAMQVTNNNETQQFNEVQQCIYVIGADQINFTMKELVAEPHEDQGVGHGPLKVFETSI